MCLLWTNDVTDDPFHFEPLLEKFYQHCEGKLIRKCVEVLATGMHLSHLNVGDVLRVSLTHVPAELNLVNSLDDIEHELSIRLLGLL